jgi:hypothetical protein
MFLLLLETIEFITVHIIKELVAHNYLSFLLNTCRKGVLQHALEPP